MLRPDPFDDFRRDVSDAPGSNIIPFPNAGLPPGVAELLMIGQVDRLHRLRLSTDNRSQKEISNAEFFVPKPARSVPESVRGQDGGRGNG